jgi:ATP-dependent DNA helicase RecG
MKVQRLITEGESEILEFKATFGKDVVEPLSVDYQSKHVLVLQVPASSQIHRCNGIVYDRGHEGDFRVTDPVRIAAMVNLKQNYYTELTVYPYLHVSDFEPGLLDKARRLIRAMTPKHPWLPLSEEELLHKAGFWRNDPLTGREGYTLAAGLMFGKQVPAPVRQGRQAPVR